MVARNLLVNITNTVYGKYMINIMRMLNESSNSIVRTFRYSTPGTIYHKPR